MYHFDEAAHHLFAGVEVCDDAVAEWADGANLGICLFVHHLCPVADGYHAFSSAVEGNDAGLVDHNLAIADDDGVGRAEVHCYFFIEGKPVHLGDWYFRGVYSNLLCEPLVDGGVVVAAYAECLCCEPFAVCQFALRALLLEQFEQGFVFCF